MKAEKMTLQEFNAAYSLYRKRLAAIDKAQARMTPIDQNVNNTDNPASQSTIQKGIDNVDGSEIDYDNII